jgi:predicted signal transduction protein with EAL and GGDEF domain
VASRRFDELPDFSFTASAGLVSVTPGVCDTLRDLIDKADRALYEAKRTGRNKVVEYRSLDAGRSLGLTGQANSPGLKTAR